MLDHCQLLSEPTPAEADTQAEWHAFEKRASKIVGGSGRAGVRKFGRFDSTCKVDVPEAVY